MSRNRDRHEGVSCDGCQSENFKYARYKCLSCYDYDLCARCYDAGITTQPHSSDHSMQCILTPADREMFFGGESVIPNQPQSFACPFCPNLGFTEASLHDHVTSEHGGASGEVICPVCIVTHLTDDLANHLAMDHLGRNEFSQEELRLQRRVPPPSIVPAGGTSVSSMMVSTRARGAQSAIASEAVGLNAIVRESTDPIAELLSQLGGIRRAGASAMSQIHQLQQQISRQAPRRTLVTSIEAGSGADTMETMRTPADPATVAPSNLGGGSVATDDFSRLQLPRFFGGNRSEDEKMLHDTELANRSLFVQELLVSTFTSSSQDRSLCQLESNNCKRNVRDDKATKSGEIGEHRSTSSPSNKNEIGVKTVVISPGTTASSAYQNGHHARRTVHCNPSVRVAATLHRPAPQQPRIADESSDVV